VEQPADLVQQLRAGDIHLYDPQPQLDLVEHLAAADSVVLDVDAGPVWEHIDFNFDNELLAERFVREAFVLAIDREAIVDALVRPVHEEAEVLQQTVYVPNQAEYEPHFDRYEHDPERAEEILEDNGCTRDDDGIFECDGGRLEFRYVSVEGNDRRERLFEIVQDQAAAVGIQLNGDFSEAREALGTKLPAGDFDLINFGWGSSPDPFGSNSIWTCGPREETLNYSQYCNEDVRDLVFATDDLLDPDERAATYNRAAALIAEDIALLPMFQLPEVLAHHESVQGAQVNGTPWTSAWNAGQWSRTASP
jgi:peptide/nickel transport system substrate-binding protein